MNDLMEYTSICLKLGRTPKEHEIPASINALASYGFDLVLAELWHFLDVSYTVGSNPLGHLRKACKGWEWMEYKGDGRDLAAIAPNYIFETGTTVLARHNHCEHRVLCAGIGIPNSEAIVPDADLFENVKDHVFEYATKNDFRSFGFRDIFA